MSFAPLLNFLAIPNESFSCQDLISWSKCMVDLFGFGFTNFAAVPSSAGSHTFYLHPSCSTNSYIRPVSLLLGHLELHH